MDNRILQVDILRGIAVLFVILFHFNLQTSHIPFWNEIVLSGGQLGVNIFFIISGLLISYPFLKEKRLNGKIYSLKKYAANRLLRIIPLYWITSVVLFFVRNNIHTYYLGNYHFTWHDTIMNLFFLSDNFRVLNPVIWTLRIEMFFYIFFPVAFVLIYRWRINFLSWIYSVFILVFLLFLLYRFYASHITSNLEGDLVSNLEGFFNGVFLAYIIQYDKLDKLFKIPYPILLPSLILLILLIINQSILHNATSFFPFFRSGCNICLFFIFTGFLRQDIHQSTWFGEKIFRFLSFTSLISYSLYLIHFNVYYDMAIPLVGGSGTLSGFKLLLTRLIALLITFSISSLSYFFIEKPFLGLKRKTSYNTLPDYKKILQN